MRKSITFIVLCALCYSLSAQSVSSYAPPSEKNATVTIGAFNGGGGLVGVDFEFLFTDKVGLQAGMGFISYGIGLNYHVGNGGIRSSFFNFGYHHMGFGDYYMQSLIGPSFVWRARKILQLQVGLGAQIETGPGLDVEAAPMQIILCGGLYFPI